MSHGACGPGQSTLMCDLCPPGQTVWKPAERYWPAGATTALSDSRQRSAWGAAPLPKTGGAPSQSLLPLWAFGVRALGHGRGYRILTSPLSPSLLCWLLCSHPLPSSLQPPPSGSGPPGCSPHAQGLYGTSVPHPSNPWGPSLPVPEGHAEDDHSSTHPGPL